MLTVQEYGAGHLDSDAFVVHPEVTLGGATDNVVTAPPLAPGRALGLYEVKVPREGVRVRRHYQYTRWFDGSTHVWIGRRKQIGRGEGSRGLGFDVLEQA